MSLQNAVADAQESAIYRLPAVLGHAGVRVVDMLVLVWASVWATLSWADVTATHSLQSLIVALIWTVIGVGTVTVEVIRGYRHHQKLRQELMHWAAKAGALRYDAGIRAVVHRGRIWRYVDGYWWVEEAA